MKSFIKRCGIPFFIYICLILTPIFLTIDSIGLNNYSNKELWVNPIIAFSTYTLVIIYALNASMNLIKIGKKNISTHKTRMLSYNKHRVR